MVVDLLSKLNDLIWSPLMFILVATGLYFTFKLGGVQFTFIKDAIEVITKKEKRVKEDEDDQISPIEAFLVGLASRIGAGNITGVATAVVVGGPGVLFWMWLIALIVAASSFVESTLGQIYKEKEEEKGFVGGPSFYMNKGLNKPLMGIIFAGVMILTYAIAFVTIQANTISSIMKSSFTSLDGNLVAYVVGIILLTLVAIVLFGGAKRIVKVSALMVPIMSFAYLILALIVIIVQFDKIPFVFSVIISQAFTFKSVTGAAIGGIIITGARRGMFSNEAGMGSAPNAAATATTSHPVKQGLVQMIGVFIDTLLVCTATGLIILLSLPKDVFISFANQALTDPSFNAIAVTQTALQTSLGLWSGWALTIFIFFFSFSSILGNYYYSESSFEYLTTNKTNLKIFKVVVVLATFYGSIANASVLWSLSDVLMGIMAFLNIIAITFLFKYVKLALDDYKKQKAEGKDPVFYEKNIEGLEGTVWTDDESIFH